jgi:hypothetical protein
MLDLVEHGLGVILIGDETLALLVDEQRIVSGSIATGASAWSDLRGRADVRPIEIGGRGAIDRERVGLVERLRLVLLRKPLGVHEPYARCDFEAPRAADHDELRHARACGSFDQCARRRRK